MSQYFNSEVSTWSLDHFMTVVQDIKGKHNVQTVLGCTVLSGIANNYCLWDHLSW
jgi:hypothetical protein